MKNAIRYYYQIEVSNLEYHNHRYEFESYALVEIYRQLDFSIYEYLIQNNYPIYQIIKNKDQNYITNIDGKNYILLFLHYPYLITLETLEQFQIPTNEKKILPWNELWMEKVDFYEKHVSTITSIKIKNSFFYYIGLTENAISFYQYIKKDATLYISHNRMEYDFDYWNPSNLIIDYKSRDIAEYVKRKFFEDTLNLSDLYLYFYRTQFEEIDYLLFYARMLYPSYYFDCYDKIILGDSENCLDIYLEKIENYECLLRNLYFSFSQFIFMPKIDWIIDK